MKFNHKGLIIMAFLLISVTGLIYTPTVQAAETYIYSTDQGNPFALSVDVLYTEDDDLLNWTGPQTWYHQVYLYTNKIYLFYWGAYTSLLDFTLEKSDTGTQIFAYTSSWDYMGTGYVLLEVTLSGTYNLTIDVSGGPLAWGFTGIGFFEVKELVLGNITNAPDTFPTSAITIAYYNFDTTKSYKQECCKYSKYLYYNSTTPNYAEVITPADDSTFSTDPLQFSQAGTYILYHPGTSMSEINEHTSETSGIPFMEGIYLLIPLIAIGIYLYMKKNRSESYSKQL